MRSGSRMSLKRLKRTLRTKFKGIKKYSNNSGYKLSDFRKSRSPRVTERVEKLIAIYLKENQNSQYRKSVLREIKQIVWFDQKDQRVFLDKLIKFNMLTQGVDISNHLDHHLSGFEERCLYRGFTNAQEFYKKLLYVGTRISTSTSFDPLPFTRNNANGEPRCLGPLLVLLHGTIQERRSAITVLKVIELVGLWSGKFEPGKITEEWKFPNTPIEQDAKVARYFSESFDKLPIKVRRKYSKKRICTAFKMALEASFPRNERDDRVRRITESSTLHFTGHNGPNGPCLSTIVLDYIALTEPGEEKLLDSIIAFAELTDNQQLLGIIESFKIDTIKVENLNNPNEKPIHSKISLKEESWGRLRPFAITDWFSHSTLRGLHDYLYWWLEAQEEDGTMDQDKVAEIARFWTSELGIYPESADLSSATDSIPVCVQEEILAYIAGPVLAKLWRYICTDRSFKTPDGTMIRYSMGQPMGISSSWPMLAIWNHIMNRTAKIYAVLSGNKPVKGTSYVVIGDDDATKSKEIFDFYQFICQDLQGVQISLLKGFHSEHQHQRNVIPGIKLMKTAEIAKRIFCSGLEISPITPKQVKTCLEDSGQFPELLFEISKRGYQFSDRLVVPKLTALAIEPKLALMLSTNPVRLAPPFTEGDYASLVSTEPFSSVVWFKYHENREELSKELLKGIYNEITSALLKVTSTINQWVMAGMTNESTTINSKWNYVCDAQSSLLFIFAELAKEKSDKLMKRSEKVLFSREPGPHKWYEIHRILRKFQTLYDVSNYYDTGRRSIKDKDQFATSFLSKLVKKSVAKIEAGSHSR
jgi:hypothetical protein